MTHPFHRNDEVATKSPAQMPAYSTYIYLLVITPTGTAWEKISDVKEAFSVNYKHPFARSTKPHITLAQFMQREMLEERIINRFKNIAKAQSPVKIELKDFGNFPSHTIYINVLSKLPLTNLSNSLRVAQKLLKFSPDDKPFFLKEPHVTVARKLVPWQHEKAWTEYSNTSFTGRFMADKMTLLRRKVDHNKYQHVADFEFQNDNDTPTQGNLFG